MKKLLYVFDYDYDDDFIVGLNNKSENLLSL